MRAPHRPFFSALIVATLLGAATRAGASLLTLTGGSLGIAIGSLPPAGFPLNVSAVPVSITSAGGFTEPASLFTGDLNLPTSLFTGVALISDLTLGNVANATKVVAPGAAGGGHASGVLRAGGGLGGPGPLAGTAFLNVLALVNMAIPLSPIGNTGDSYQLLAGTLVITLVGTGWTTAPVTLTGLTTDGVNTVTVAGYDNRTAAHDGVVRLVSPFKLITNAAGNLPGFAVQTLTFAGGVPEPGTLALLGAAAAALASWGWRRRRG
jgi:hypothetical protein